MKVGSDDFDLVSSAMHEAFQAFMPPPNLKMSDWSDQYRVLSPESSASPGKWSTDFFPPMRDVMDALCDPSIESVCLMKSAQVSYTEMLGNAVGYYSHQDPSLILVVFPSETSGKTWSKDRLSPMIRDTPCLSAIYPSKKQRDAGNTVLEKSFPNGGLAIASAASPTSLCSRPRRIILLDEVDRYPASSGSEGDPVRLAVQRAEGFWNRKVFMGSTPLVKGTSRIEKAYLETSQMRCFVPCLECGFMQALFFKNLKFDTSSPLGATYACEGCKRRIPHAEKQAMVRKYEWRDTCNGKPLRPDVAGFHISALYSPLASWGGIATQFLESKDDPESLKTFVNTRLGETFDESYSSSKLDYEEIYNRREDYEKVPDRVKLLVGGVDVQGDRLECLVVGFCDTDIWIIDYMVVEGNPLHDDVWERMKSMIKKPYEREDGRLMEAKVIGLDTGGHHTAKAYQFCANYANIGFLAFKGERIPGRPVISKGKRLFRHNINLYMIGTDTVKDSIFDRILIHPDEPYAIHYPWFLTTDFFAQLTSERKVSTYKAGVKLTKYKTFGRNEVLDMLVYAIAAKFSAGVDLKSSEPFILRPAIKSSAINNDSASQSVVSRSASSNFIGGRRRGV